MNLNKFTEKAQEAVVAAPQLASEMSHAQVEPEHLLVTLAEQQGGVVPSVLRKLKVDPAASRGDCAKTSASSRRRTAAPSRTSRLACASVLDAAQADAKSMQDELRQHRAPAARPARRAAAARRRSTALKGARRHARSRARGAGHRCAAASA